MKHIRKLALVLVVSLMLACVGAAAGAEGVSANAVQPSVFAFPGISSWAVPEVLTLYSRDGVPVELMSNFGASITRGEFTAIIYGAMTFMDVELTYSETNEFTDIDDSPYKEHILCAYDKNIIQGRDQYTFDPDASISRQEAAKILYSFLMAMGEANELKNADRSELPFDDAGDIADWAVPYVYCAWDMGLMQGTDLGFEPGGTLTREQAMVIICRMCQSTETEGQAVTVTDPVYRAVALGISDYDNDENDGQRFQVSVNEYMEKLPNLTVNGKAWQVTPALNILKKDFYALLDQVFGQADDDDVSILLTSGHGLETGKLAFSDGKNLETESYSSIVEAMSKYRGTKVLIVGNCFSGKMLEADAIDESFVIITACRADEESYGVENVTDGYTYNLFERAILHALHYDNGFNADYDGDGVVYAYELAAYVKFELNQILINEDVESNVQFVPGWGAAIATGVTQ